MISTAPRKSAGIRGGQRRNWMDETPTIAPNTPKRLGRFTLISDSVSVIFTVTETQITVVTKPGHGNYQWLVTRKTMTLTEARQHYAKLLRAGYTEW